MANVTALWRGEVPLGKTGGLYGLVGMAILTGLLMLLSSQGASAAAKPLVLALSGAVLCYAAFISVAIWRSAGKHRGALAWRLLAKGSVLFVALQVVVGLAIA